MNPADGWAVVGGGLLGMTMAHTLAKQGRKVTLLESSAALGGLAGAWQIGEIVWDRHYHVTLLSDQAVRGLLAELGLDANMRWKKTKTGFFHGGKIYPFSSAIDFARFPLLTVVEKLRLGTTILRASRLKDWRSIEDMTVEAWLRRLSGSGVFNKIWRPLLRAKLGDDYKTTSATFLWATIQRLYAARNTGLKEELFGYLPGGYANMLARFEEVLGQAGIRLLKNALVQRIERSDGKLMIRMAAGERLHFDRVIVTAPSPVAASICYGLSNSEREKHQQVEYSGIICASVLTKRRLSDYYVTNILDETIPFTGLIEMSALVESSELKGHGLLYIPRYLRPDHSDFHRTDEDLKAEMLDSLKRMHPLLADEDVIASRISRARYVFARPTLGYSSKLPPIDTSVPGLSIVNSSHVVNGTLNANETVALAVREALRIHANEN